MRRGCDGSRDCAYGCVVQGTPTSPANARGTLRHSRTTLRRGDGRPGSHRAGLGGHIGRLGKIPKRCKIGVAESENHDESQPRDTVRLPQVRFSNASAVAFPRARPPGVLSGDQVRGYSHCYPKATAVRHSRGGPRATSTMPQPTVTCAGHVAVAYFHATPTRLGAAPVCSFAVLCT